MRGDDPRFVDIHIWFGEYSLSVGPSSDRQMLLGHIDGEAMEVGVREIELMLKKYWEDNF